MNVDDAATPLLENLSTAVWVAYALLGGLGLLAAAIDGLADGAFFRQVGRALVQPNPPRAWLWLFLLFVLTCLLEVFFIAPAAYPNGSWGPHVLAFVLPERLQDVWYSNVFEEVFRFGGFFLLAKFVRSAVAVFTTALLFTLSHDYYLSPLHVALTLYAVAFMLGVLFLFIGLRFGVLTVYAFHLAVNTFHLGVYVEAPPGWLWVNWPLALVTVVPLVCAFKRAGLQGLGGKPGISEDEPSGEETVPARV